MMSKSVKVALLVFNPFTNDSRVLKEATSLSKKNFNVTVVAHGSKNLPMQEFLSDDILVNRLSCLDRKSAGTFGKIKAYLDYARKSVQFARHQDILHCNDLNTLPIGVVVKLFFNRDVKIVYDAHEYEINDRPDEGKLSVKLKYFLEKALIRYADRVITVSNAIADEYVKLYDIPKPALVLNTPPYKEVEKKDLFRETFGITKERAIFLYQGGLSRGRGIEILLDAFMQLNDEKEKCRAPVVVFMGYGPLEEKVKKAAEEYENIYFHPAVSPDVLLNYTSSADFGISLIEDICLSYRYSLPNKMFEYLMADLPVIISNLPEMRRIVEKNRVGVVAEQNSMEGLKKAVEEAMKLDKEEFRENIQRVKKTYNWEAQEKILLKVYKELYID